MAGWELIDAYGPAGELLGPRHRSAVHADGLWHPTFHCWVIAQRPAGPVLVCQRRGRRKTRPGMLDASAGGHVLAGESVAAASREIHEELGVVVPFETLTGLGVFRIEHGSGGCDREIAHVFVLHDDRPVRDWVFDHTEASALVEVPVSVLIDPTMSAVALEWNGRHPSSTTVSRNMFVPLGEAYWEALLVAAQQS